MNTLIEAALRRSRTVILILVLAILWGLVAYIRIPKESTPDVKIPIIYVLLRYEGISPQDSERLLLRPVEQELRGLEGVKEIKSTAHEGGGSVVIEFMAGFNSEKAKNDVRDRVETAKSKIPKGSNEPLIKEVNLSLFPVLLIKLSGEIPRRTLHNLSIQLRNAIESNVKSVLSVAIVGDQEEVVDVLLNPTRTQAYDITFDDVLSSFQRNNQLISAGSLTGESGHFSVKVPGVLENVLDIMQVPVIASGDRIIRLQDVAEVRRTFKDPEGFARDRGVPMVALEVSKRTGENLIETVENVKKVVEHFQEIWPEQVKISFAQDESFRIRDMLNDLQNNIILAIILVMGVIIWALGTRSAILVGISVPGSFLMGIMVISLLGLTVNIVVLFSLIFSVGMLVDGAVIVVEYADRKMAEGLPPRQAFLEAAQRMAWPVITSTLTILVVFFPLLFWPGIPGQFMKFMPITLLAVLTASILMALIFVPTIGALLSHKPSSESDATVLAASESGNLEDVQGFSKWYLNVLKVALNHPARVIMGALLVLFFVKELHSVFGKGVEFFPNIEPDAAAVQIHARGNLSIHEKDALVKQVEARLFDMKELKSIYTRTGAGGNFMENAAEDLIGSITMEFVDWKERRKVDDILEDVLNRTRELPGLNIEVVKKKSGPPAEKPIALQITSYDSEKLLSTLLKARQFFEKLPGITGLEDNRPISGIEWQMKIDRSQAARFLADVASIGNGIKLVTNGVLIGTYRPEDAQDEVDIVVRYFAPYRTMEYLDELRVRTPNGPMPISNFVTRTAQPKTGTIDRVDGYRVYTLEADVEPGHLVADKIQAFQEWSKTADFDPSVQMVFKGEEQDRQESMFFLMGAFLVAIFVIAIILVTQFNSFFSMGLILSSVVMSSVGVYVGLLINNLPFGIVMGGVGVIALAGIIVSNNIILIDTFDLLMSHQTNPSREKIREIILRTCIQRLRPVILTKLTAILGLLPIMFGINIDFLGLEITHGAPSTQWWILLSTCIVYGLLFASSMTLLVTPAALMIRANRQFGIKSFTKKELFLDVLWLKISSRVLK